MTLSSMTLTAMVATLLLAAGCTKKPSIKEGPAPGGATAPARFDDDTRPKVDEVRETPTLPGDEFNNSAPGSAGESKIIIDTGDAKTPPSGGIGEGGRSGSNISGDGTIKYQKFSGTVTEQQIADWVAKDKEKRGAAAADYRYSFIPNEYLNDDKRANYARIALSKALNSVAIDADDIVHPEEASENHGIVFAIPIKKYWLDAGERKWNIVASAVTKRVFSPASRLDLRAFDANQPVNAARLVYNMLHGGIYNQLIETPGRGQQLIRSIAGEVTHRIGVQNAITYGPRYAQRRQLNGRPGSYWESFDDFNGRRRELIWINNNNPIPRFRGDGMVADFGTVASEAWQHMKNGMLAYYIWGNANQERSKAEFSFVRDPLNNKNGELQTGACIYCHISGAQSAPNDMWKAIEDGRITGQAAERARAFWTDQEALAKVYAEDQQIFQTALQKIVLGISDGDKDFNEGIISGADPKEPAYTLVALITGNRNAGDTTGLRNRDQIEQNQNNRQGGRQGGGQGFGGGGW